MLAQETRGDVARNGVDHAPIFRLLGDDAEHPAILVHDRTAAAAVPHSPLARHPGFVRPIGHISLREGEGDWPRVAKRQRRELAARKTDRRALLRFGQRTTRDGHARGRVKTARAQKREVRRFVHLNLFDD